jgi:hypothetical protein
MNITPYKLVDLSTKEFLGVRHKAGSRGKPRFGRNLTLPTRVASPYQPYALFLL